jgi:Zn-dependent peptidase ImmA (M78 family)
MAKSKDALINKETLAFICSQIGVTSKYLASKASLPEDKVALWLDINNNTLPTIIQAKEVAKALQIPFASLYMDNKHIVVDKLPPITSLRTIISGKNFDDSALNIAIADLIRSRDFLLSAETELSIENTPFLLPKISDSDTSTIVATTIRSFFGLELSEQYKYGSQRQFYLYLRRKIESKGIFINCFSDVNVETARGVAISDGGIPIIGINANDRPPAKSFSIIHELVHIIKRKSTICNEMFSSFSKKQEEVFCNAVAGEVLVPSNALDEYFLEYNIKTISELDIIDNIVKKFCVSREVITRRLYDTGKITENEYITYVNKIRRDFELEKEAKKNERQKGGGEQPWRNLLREAVDKNSSAICRILFLGYGEGYFSKQDVSGLLGIKENYIPAFIAEVARWEMAIRA